MTFTDSRTLVIGGSSGIGLATAVAAARAGAIVTIASRQAAKLDSALRELGPSGSAVQLDIRDAAAVENYFGECGEWDHVVVSASETKSGSIHGLSLGDARAAMESKFWGAYHVARACRIRPGGSLTLVSGVFSQRPNKEAVLQGAINAALEGLARGLALSLAPVRVNVVSPSVTRTPLWDKLDETHREIKYTEASMRFPAGRVGQPEDIAAAILYVAANPYSTGATILVDGGDALV
ncbi:SDR family oxidoreductase [Noviherbaspirillum suwonense]|uniref:NAD(P)-dependent dehydrogenase, short-chain alcohol dehydrogenase family n=1 Tax=Noviherbaspirillum suwonense TaxID=1224511 RepID=A0ABY1QW99_9BURK|nr:SDR family oxidoreductase [Noviherbaspirillum suwonense]SMP80608.1 NAD(P)-dependent dehydrogenase, short-chain alcohol dehydrogenase family [Noviherbaspirillum suwonense]